MREKTSRSHIRSLFRVCTTDATNDHLGNTRSTTVFFSLNEQPHLVPYLSMPLTNFSSSSGAQPSFTTSEAIFANHLLRQSLLVLLGTWFAIARHLDGLELSGSSMFMVSIVSHDEARNGQTLLDSFTKKLVLLSGPRSAFLTKHLRHIDTLEFRKSTVEKIEALWK